MLITRSVLLDDVILAIIGLAGRFTWVQRAKLCETPCAHFIASSALHFSCSSAYTVRNKVFLSLPDT